MDHVKLHDKTFKPFIPYEKIISAIDKVADKINQDFHGCTDIPIVLCVLNGSIVFTGELLKRLNFPCQLVSMKLTSYEGTFSTGKVRQVMGLTSSVRDRRVIVVEDIVDTGNTIFDLCDILKGEGVEFDAIHIDRSFPADNLPTRKPGTGMLKQYMTGEYDLSASWVIGDRETDAKLAQNLGCKSLILGEDMNWLKITELLFAGERTSEVVRTTRETDITVRLNLDGNGKSDIQTGLGFFDHMLEQIAKHGMIDLYIRCNGDLNVDEHHTIEDTALALGECILKALGDKRGIERYGYCLPMDDCLCQVALDFGGRPWLVWNAEFKREKVGEMPTEMFLHFFKSLSDSARMNLNIKAEGENEHHKIEGIFKALARSLRMAVRRDVS